MHGVNTASDPTVQPSDLDLAEDLMQTCYEMYRQAHSDAVMCSKWKHLRDLSTKSPLACGASAPACQHAFTRATARPQGVLTCKGHDLS